MKVQSPFTLLLSRSKPEQGILGKGWGLTIQPSQVHPSVCYFYTLTDFCSCCVDDTQSVRFHRNRTKPLGPTVEKGC